MTASRAAFAQRGRRLEWATIAWNAFEAAVALLAGTAAGSVSLVGFGADSLIEVASGAALLWRMSVDADPARREAAEKRTLRFVGLSFLALAGYVAYDAVTDLATQAAPDRSVPGILIAIASLVVMPLLSRAKRRVGAALGSRAMHADAAQADFCAYLSAILLAGLLLHALLGWWWTDGAAALVMVPIIANEGVAALRADPCC